MLPAIGMVPIQLIPLIEHKKSSDTVFSSDGIGFCCQQTQNTRQYKGFLDLYSR